jgi:uncharacterized protein with FMN-binding domain
MINPNSEGLDAGQAARLDALSNRRSGSVEATERPQLDDELAARIARLADQRSGSTTAGVTRKPRKRRHAAKKSRIAALTLSLMTTAGLTLRFMANDIGSAVTLSSAQTASTAPESASAQEAGTTASAAGRLTPAEISGDAFSNQFGVVQVQATFGADGSIVDVGVTQAPGPNWRSARISSLAIPMLNSEALTAQSAQVDTISGATYTSIAYQRSLQSAIDQARIDGLTQLT